MTIQKRSILILYLNIILTLGIYYIYWQYKTKNEMNEEFGGNIPTYWLIIIPIANIYWLYKYTECFVEKVKGEDDTVLWFLIFWLVGIVMPWVVQSELNKFADNPQLLQQRKIQRETRFCTKCGRRIPFDAVYCPFCGHKFEVYL